MAGEPISREELEYLTRGRSMDYSPEMSVQLAEQTAAQAQADALAARTPPVDPYLANHPDASAALRMSGQATTDEVNRAIEIGEDRTRDGIGEPISDQSIAENNAGAAIMSDEQKRELAQRVALAKQQALSQGAGLGQPSANEQQILDAMSAGQTQTQTTITSSPEAVRTAKRIEKELLPAQEQAQRELKKAKFAEIDEQAQMIDKHVAEREFINLQAETQHHESRDAIMQRMADFEERQGAYRQEIQDRLRQIDDPQSVVRNMSNFQKTMLVMGSMLAQDGTAKVSKNIQGMIDRSVATNSLAVKTLSNQMGQERSNLKTLVETHRGNIEDVLKERERRIVEAQEILKLRARTAPAAMKVKYAEAHAELTQNLIQGASELAKIQTAAKRVSTTTTKTEGISNKTGLKLLDRAKQGGITIDPALEREFRKNQTKREDLLVRMRDLQRLLRNSQSLRPNLWPNWADKNAADIKAAVSTIATIARKAEFKDSGAGSDADFERVQTLNLSKLDTAKTILDRLDHWIGRIDEAGHRELSVLSQPLGDLARKVKLAAQNSNAGAVGVSPGG